MLSFASLITCSPSFLSFSLPLPLNLSHSSSSDSPYPPRRINAFSLHVVTMRPRVMHTLCVCVCLCLHVLSCLCFPYVFCSSIYVVFSFPSSLAVLHRKRKQTDCALKKSLYKHHMFDYEGVQTETVCVCVLFLLFSVSLSASLRQRRRCLYLIQDSLECFHLRALLDHWSFLTLLVFFKPPP